MDIIEIVKFSPYASNETLQALSYQLDRECNRITLKEINWPDAYPYCPEIHFRIAYNEQHIFLKFDVHENEFRATEIEDHRPVWEDSCVEFFVQLENCKMDTTISKSMPSERFYVLMERGGSGEESCQQD